MRKNTLKLLAVAPATLALAACGGNEEAAAPADDNLVEAPAPAADGDMPQVGLDARGTVDYAGTYAMADGSSLALTADDTYTMTSADGTETTGDFTWYSDNSRILIKDGDTNHVFAVADGALYKMADADASIEGPMDASMAYTKAAM